MRFFAPPFRLVEPEDNGAAMIVDAAGSAVAMMMWPGHTPEDTEAAEQETYAVGRRFAESGTAARSIRHHSGILKGLEIAAEIADDYAAGQFTRAVQNLTSKPIRAETNLKYVAAYDVAKAIRTRMEKEGG
jgi:hypothetical protein